MEEVMTFTGTDAEGNNVEYEVLLTFDSEETKKSYMIYTDNTLDEEGNTKVYASIYVPNEDLENTVLSPIETDKEWSMIEAIIEEIQSENVGDDE